jgi:hypothetical protein
MAGGVANDTHTARRLPRHTNLAGTAPRPAAFWGCETKR